jgi:hypothetical protein
MKIQQTAFVRFLTSLFRSARTTTSGEINGNVNLGAIDAHIVPTTSVVSPDALSVGTPMPDMKFSRDRKKEKPAVSFNI